MVRVTEPPIYNENLMTAKVSLFADDKSDVTANMKIIGLKEGYDLEFSSSILTAKGELAFLKSDGTWQWN